MSLERPYNQEYTDYELGWPAKSVVVEAKREGAYFDLPAGFDQNTCSIKKLGDISEDIKAAISQCIKYCQQRGIGIGVVTNGRQFIAFLGSRQDGVPPELGRALVFHSLSNIKERFRDFWDYLSPEGVSSRNLSRLLSAKSFKRPPEKFSSRITHYPGIKDRNPIAADLQILGGSVLEDI